MHPHRVNTFACVSTVSTADHRVSDNRSNNSIWLYKKTNNWAIQKIQSNRPISIFTRRAHDKCTTPRKNDTIVTRCDVDSHSCVTVFIRSFHFDGKKHDAKFKTDATQSKLSSQQKISYVQDTFGERFSIETWGHRFKIHRYASAPVIQISPRPNLRLVEKIKHEILEINLYIHSSTYFVQHSTYTVVWIVFTTITGRQLERK
jgi:hypothetical protein